MKCVDDILGGHDVGIAFGLQRFNKPRRSGNRCHDVVAAVGEKPKFKGLSPI